MRTTTTVALLLLAHGTALGFLPAPYGGTITAPLPDMPASLDPALARRESELQVVSLLFDTLYRIGDKGKPVPHLVEPEVERSADKKTWTLPLRAGVTLHNGQTLTVAKVAASLERLRAGTQGHLLAPVRAVVAGDGAVVIQLRRPAPELPWLLSAPAAGIGVKHRGGWIGSGPFKLRSRGASRLDLVAHRGHFAGRPYLDGIRFKVFERPSAEVASFQVGTLQLSFHGTSVFGSQPRHPFRSVETAPTTLVYLGVSRSRPYMADRRFRLALLKGIDRARLGKLAATGRHEVAASPVCRHLLRSGASAVAFDRTGANRLLGQLADRHSALPRDAASGRLRLSLLVDRSRPEASIVAGQLVADLDRIGIAVTIDARPADEYTRRVRSKSYDLVLGHVPVQVPRASVALAGVLAAAGQPGRARNCLAAVRCGDREARRLMRELPLVPLIHTSAKVAHDARLGRLRLRGGGLVRYDDVYLTRAP